METETPTDAGGGGEPTASRDWWLRLQLGLSLAGGAAWFAGAFIEQEFLAGAGCGLILAALVLRLGRKADAD
ncbi:hypothetical protein [Candidatus Palauibacter sp.]|uniref:hypothetical protein n=1 Tax=Candidatus Palauibacter sp. TaxID=3101350 RepID=UPI003C6FF256